MTTEVSLLPAKGAPLDLTVTVTAEGYVVIPAGPQDSSFVDGQSKSLVFILTTPLPDMGGRDAAKDGAAKDASPGTDGAAADLATTG